MLGISNAATVGIPTIVLTQSGTTKNFDLASWIGVEAPKTIHCTIQTGAIMYADGDDVGIHPGWDSGGGWLTGSSLILVNDGSVYGYRGGGATSGNGVCNTTCNASGGQASTKGGDAFRVLLPTSFTNTGFIGPGGGGGGAGGHGIWERDSDNRISFAGGGGGGQGAGYTSIYDRGGNSTSNCATSFSGSTGDLGSLTRGGRGGFGDNNGSARTAYVYTDIDGYDGNTDGFGAGGAAGGWFGRAGGTGGLVNASNTGFTLYCRNNDYLTGGIGGYSINGYSNVFSYSNSGTVYGVTN